MIRSFASLCYVSFACTFTDNAFRLILWIALSAWAVENMKDPDDYRSLIAGLYTAPMLLFSIFAGQLSDRFSKRDIIIGTRILEIIVWVLGMFVFLQTSSLAILLIMLFFLGFRFAIFGPPSSGLIGELLPEHHITKGTGGLELVGTIGGLLGTVLGGVIIDAYHDNLSVPVVLLTVFAVSGFIAAVMIDKVPVADPSRKLKLIPISQLLKTYRYVKSNHGMYLASLGVVFWWGIASLAMFVALKYAQDTLGYDGTGTGRFFVYVALSMVLSAVFIGKFAKGHFELGFVPIGGIMMGLSFIMMGFIPKTEFSAALVLSIGGFFAGWFMIPLKSHVIKMADREMRGGILGALNFCQYASIFLFSAVGYYILTSVLGLDATTIFVLMGIAMVLVSIWIVYSIPTIALRFTIALLIKVLMRIRVKGEENIPETGGGILVCNHTAYVDALVIIATAKRKIRPIMYDEMYEKPYIKIIADMNDPLTISDRMGPRELITSLKNCTEAINNGDLLMIFAEGQITRTGHVHPFRKGIERIMRDVDAPIIPVAADGLRNNILSYGYDRKFIFLPKQIKAPVRINYGKPLPPDTKVHEVNMAVQRLISECWLGRKSQHELLHRYALRLGKRRPFEVAFYDQKRPEGISRIKFSAGIVAFAKHLRPLWKDKERIGICLPPSIGAAIINHAALLAGKVTVNLNYTASTDVIEKTCDNAEVDLIITSKEFMEKANVELPGKLVFAEELAEEITDEDRKSALFEYLRSSVESLERKYGNNKRRTMDDTATIIYSSGSTGIPKGVCLTHWNIASNMRQITEVFPLSSKDTILGILPFFHSFGTMVTLFLPHMTSMKASYLPSPLDTVAIGNVARLHKITFLVATPTFLNSFSRRIDARDFGSVKYVLAGAEKLRPQIAEAFESKFGVGILEGYGCTEASPVIAVNTPEYRAPSLYQKTNKKGTIGKPLPGMCIRIVDPSTEEELEQGQEGLLQVKGPNIMKGYLKQPEKTAEVLKNGWYSTGDIAKIDDEGFITITDRLSRLSKIGGEMVPHIMVEQALQSTCDKEEICFVVTGVEDTKKGEKLVILTTLKVEEAKSCLEKVSTQKQIPNLWIPKANDIYQIDQIPLLGSGKMDLKQLGSMAKELSQS